MSGIMCAIAGIAASGGGGGGVTREPTTGDYYDANNRVTRTSFIGGSPPGSTYTRVVFRWGGVDVFDTGNVPYPAVANNSSPRTDGFIYRAGALQSISGSDPTINVYGIYRES